MAAWQSTKLILIPPHHSGLARVKTEEQGSAFQAQEKLKLRFTLRLAFMFGFWNFFPCAEGQVYVDDRNVNMHTDQQNRHKRAQNCSFASSALA